MSAMQSVAQKQSRYVENLSQMIWSQKGFYESLKNLLMVQSDKVLYKQKYIDNLAVSFPSHSDEVECVTMETE